MAGRFSSDPFPLTHQSKIHTQTLYEFLTGTFRITSFNSIESDIYFFFCNDYRNSGSTRLVQTIPSKSHTLQLFCTLKSIVQKVGRVFLHFPVPQRSIPVWSSQDLWKIHKDCEMDNRWEATGKIGAKMRPYMDAPSWRRDALRMCPKKYNDAIVIHFASNN